MPKASRLPLATALVSFSLGVAACGTQEKVPDTARMAPGAASHGMLPDSMAAMAGTAATPGMAAQSGDADHDFLRMMSDHHKGLIALVHMTQDRRGIGTAKADAAKMDQTQDAELDTMMTMLEKTYTDPCAPKVMPEHQAMATALEPMSGKGYERSFYGDIVKHHTQAITVIDGYLQKAKSADVKAMAEKMKVDQTREIADFQKKLAKMGG